MSSLADKIENDDVFIMESESINHRSVFSLVLTIGRLLRLTTNHNGDDDSDRALRLIQVQWTEIKQTS